MRIDVEAHRRLRVPHALGKFPRGHPAGLCASRARQRRARASAILDNAARHDELAAETLAGRVRGFGSFDYLVSEAQRLRALAAAITDGIPP
jgi:hypothetical protein